MANEVKARHKVVNSKSEDQHHECYGYRVTQQPIHHADSWLMRLLLLFA